MRRTLARLLAASALAHHLAGAQPDRTQHRPATAQPQAGEWTAYGHDALGSRYSPLATITRENVARLTVAWTYRTGEAGVRTRQSTKFEATPLMVDGTLYLSTPFGRVIALDAESGRERWTFDSHPDRGGDWGDFANRGVSTVGAFFSAPSTRESLRSTQKPGRCAAGSARRVPCTSGRDCTTRRSIPKSTN